MGTPGDQTPYDLPLKSTLPYLNTTFLSFYTLLQNKNSSDILSPANRSRQQVVFSLIGYFTQQSMSVVETFTARWTH